MRIFMSAPQFAAPHPALSTPDETGFPPSSASSSFSREFPSWARTLDLLFLTPPPVPPPTRQSPPDLAKTCRRDPAARPSQATRPYLPLPGLTAAHSILPYRSAPNLGRQN